MSADREELLRLVRERLETESTEDLVKLGSIFGLDQDTLEAASPMMRVQMLVDGIELAQLADILEIRPAGSGAATAAESFELPPPRSEADILAAERGEQFSAGPGLEEQPEAVFAADLPPLEESPAPAPAGPASGQVDVFSELPEEEAPSASSKAGELPLSEATAGAENAPTELPPLRDFEPASGAEAASEPTLEAIAEGGPAPEGPSATATADVTSAMLSEMMASGDLKPEDLEALQREAEPEGRHAPEDELDVLQQLRLVRKDTARSREREKAERRKKREQERLLAELSPEQKRSRFRLWLFRATLVIFIVLVASRSSVVIQLPDKATRLSWLVQIKITSSVPEELQRELAQTQASQTRPPNVLTGLQQPPKLPPKPVVPPPSDALGADLTRAFVETDLQAGDLQGAIELASRSLNVSIEDVKAKIFGDAGKAQQDLDRGMALLMAQDLPAAEVALRKAVETQGPTQANGMYYLGHALRLQGKYDEALGFFQQAVGRDPKMAEAFVGAAQVLRKKGDLPSAVGQCRSAIAARATFLPAHYELGDLLKEQQNWPEALGVYEELLKLDAGQSYALFSIGLIQYKQNNFEDAVQRFQKAIDANRSWRYGDLGLAYNNLGNCFDSLKQPAKAIAAYEAASKARPDDGVIQYNLARAYQRYEYPHRAIAPYETAVDLLQVRSASEVGDLYPRALYNLAECYMRIHDFQAAARRYDEVLALKPELTTVREKLERALEAGARAQQFSYDYGTPMVDAAETSLMAIAGTTMP